MSTAMHWRFIPVAFLVALVLAVAPDPGPHQPGPAARIEQLPRIIGYYDAKSQEDLPVGSIPVQHLTHVVLTNALKVDSAGQLHYRSKMGATDLPAQELIARLAALPVKLIISLRGHEDDVALDELAEVDATRERFATNISEQLRDWGAHGLEIEWHSDDPAGGKAITAPFDEMEQLHFALLCKDLASALRAAGGLTLSVAVRPGRQEFSDGAFVQSYIDWLTLRAYSMRSLGDPHHSSLKDMTTALEEWTRKNVSKKQLVLGTPLFARPGAALHKAGDRNEGLRLPWKNVSTAGLLVPKGSDEKGDLFLDSSSGKAWWFSGHNTTRSKMTYVLNYGYGGIALRDLHYDHPPGVLSLLQAVADAARDHRQTKRRHYSVAQPMSLFQRGLKRSRSMGDNPGTEGDAMHDEF